MQRRVREYFYASRHLEQSKSNMALLDMMSPKLQGEVSMLCNREWIEKVWFLSGLEEEFHIQARVSSSPSPSPIIYPRPLPALRPPAMSANSRWP